MIISSSLNFRHRHRALLGATMNLAKFSEMFDKKKTFRPKKKFQPGTMKYSLHKQAQASLNSGINLRQVVKLPKVPQDNIFRFLILF